jgi:hypothetical protein
MADASKKALSIHFAGFLGMIGWSLDYRVLSRIGTKYKIRPQFLPRLRKQIAAKEYVLEAQRSKFSRDSVRVGEHWLKNLRAKLDPKYPSTHHSGSAGAARGVSIEAS